MKPTGDLRASRASETLTEQSLVDRFAGMTQAEISRRNVLRGLFLGIGAASLPSWVLQHAVAHAQTPGGPELSIPLGPLGAQDFGPLEQKVVADHLPSVNHQLFAPAGFNVRVVMRFGVNPITLDTTGTLGHVNPDGGAVYPTPEGGWIYVSNSEINPGGSVSALRFDSAGTLVDYRRICTGTRQNCAGGKTPWGTWITCEEVTGGFAHECDPFGEFASRQLTALGARNGREAVTIDPIYHVIYQTLDANPGKFIRFVSDPLDLEELPNGVTRMHLDQGISTRLLIPAFNGQTGYDNIVVPNTTAGSTALRQARPIQWVADSGTNGTSFNGSEGIWYYEVPELLRTIPSAGSVPTRGVVFFATKGDNRLWAIDVENQLIELIYDTQNGQAFTNLRNAGGTPSNFNQVDNVVVSPMGDVLVAEDGTAMRLAIMFNGVPAKLLMQITLGNSEIAGPAFTTDGSRLYFSSQRGPGGTAGTTLSGVIYEMTIPERFRAIQHADAFEFSEGGASIPADPGAVVTSPEILLSGFLGPLVVSISAGNDGQFSIDGGEWASTPTAVVAGQTLRVRHTGSSVIGETTTSTVTVGLANGAGQISRNFTTVATEAVAVPALSPLSTAALAAGLLGAGALAARQSDAGMTGEDRS